MKMVKFVVPDTVLDMARSSVHDAYKGCVPAMLTKVKVNLNDEITANMDDFGSQFGTENCFEIETCYGASVEKYTIMGSLEAEILIPPYEKFKIEEVKNRNTVKDLWCKVVFKLKSATYLSDLNCTLV
ncbi:ecto-ADP-ribosyltransferase 4-like [Oncorhynchus masou masou]|uniref:ecto-ADP-ribosyltransferase 4-like n=1 Tax=Oncorhynchus masou masou TaxID=90313 RepID=UPI003182E9C8